jgi:hypothetical protein
LKRNFLYHYEGSQQRATFKVARRSNRMTTTNKVFGLTQYINSLKGDNIALSVLGHYANQSGDSFNARLAEKLVAANKARVCLENYQAGQRARAAMLQHGIDPATMGF